MNKVLKHKSSSRNVKGNKSYKTKEHSALTSRGPFEKHRSNNMKKHLQKFKSIPIITYQDMETNYPNDKLIHLSSASHENKLTLQYNSETEPPMVNSTYERPHSGSKISLHSKLNVEKDTNVSSKNKTNCTIKTQYRQSPDDFSEVYRRTKCAFEEFKKK